MDERADETLLKKNKIDELLDEVGYSYYHFFMLSVFILIFFADGTEVLVISLILKSLEKEWQLSPITKSIVASSAFIGLMIGSFVSSRYLDLYGRKKFLIVSGGIILVFGYLSSISTNTFQLFSFRLCMGLGIGSQIPAATNLAAETIPTYNRSMYLANMWIAFPMGELYVCVVAMYIMPDFEQGQWRKVMLFCLFPVFLSLSGSFFLYESSRYYLAYNKTEKAREVLYKLASWSKVTITEERMEDIIFEGVNNTLNKYQSNYKILLTKRFSSLTINSCMIWFFSSAGLYTGVYMLPQVLARISPVNNGEVKKNIFRDLIISNIITLPKTMLAGFLSDLKFFGRIGTLYLGFALSAFSALLTILDVGNIYLYAGLIKLLTGQIMAVAKVYATEAYPTKIRGIGYGTGHSFARLAGMLVPFISEGLWSAFGILAPFYFVLIISLIGLYNTYNLPFETLGRTLDKPEREDLIELKEVKDF